MLQQCHGPNDYAVTGMHRHRLNVVNLVDRVLTWFEVARQRRQLATFDDRMLSDIGVGRADAWHEVHRHFWDIPKDPHERR